MKRIGILMGIVLVLAAGTASGARLLSEVIWQQECRGQLEVVPIEGGATVTCYEEAQDPAPTAPPAPTDPAPAPTMAPTATAPANAAPLPGRLEAEDYRSGGEGVGYHDTTPGNRGGTYRQDDVDIEACRDGNGCFNVGWVRAGEWLAYDVSIAQAGTYQFRFRIGTPNDGRRLHVELDGVDLTGAVALPNTGRYHRWADAYSDPVSLPAGFHTLRVVADTELFNLNFIEVLPVDSAPPPPAPTTAPPTPTAVPSEPPPEDHSGLMLTFPLFAADMVNYYNQMARSGDMALLPSGNTRYLSQIRGGMVRVGYPSWAEAEAALPGLVGQIDIISYNPEHWDRTPAEEQANLVATVRRASEVAHSYGLPLMVSPDRRFAADHLAEIAPYADYIGLQGQRLQDDPQGFATWARELIAIARAANPAVKIIVQVSSNQGPASEMYAAIETIADQIDGVSIWTSAQTFADLQAFVSMMRP